MEMKEELINIIASVAEIPNAEVQEDVSLQELGIDSLMALEIVAKVEKRFKVEIPEEQIVQVRSLSDILKLVHLCSAAALE